MGFSGIRMFAWVGGITLLYVGAAIAIAGGYLTALPYVMKPTAHLAFLFFFMAFTASSFHNLMRGSYSRWAMKNRRYLGLSFALVHFIHAGLVLSNITFTDESREPAVLAAGGFAYILLALMALTSNNSSVKTLGAKNWRRLHLVGSWYIWIIFSADVPMLFTGENLPRTWISVFCIAALILRIIAFWKKRRKLTSQPAA